MLKTAAVVVALLAALSLLAGMPWWGLPLYMIGLILVSLCVERLMGP